MEPYGIAVAAYEKIRSYVMADDCPQEVAKPNTKSRFWSKKNLNFKAKIKILGFSATLNSNFGISK